MATKKQKREAAQAKRAKMLAGIKADGLAAQQRDREAQEAERQSIKQEVDEVMDRYRNILARHGIHGW